MHKHIDIYPHSFVSVDLEKIPKMVYDLKDDFNGYILRYMSETPEGLFEFLSTYFDSFDEMTGDGSVGNLLSRPSLKKIIHEMGNLVKLVEPGVIDVPCFRFNASRIKPEHVEKFKHTLCYKHYYPCLILNMKPLGAVY